MSFCVCVPGMHSPVIFLNDLKQSELNKSSVGFVMVSISSLVAWILAFGF